MRASIVLGLLSESTSRRTIGETTVDWSVHYPWYHPIPFLPNVTMSVPALAFGEHGANPTLARWSRYRR